MSALARAARPLRALARASAVAAIALAAGCGSSNGASGTQSGSATVYAASSLTDVFAQIDQDATFNFAASDTLATQIREGAPADVYAAANERLPKELSAEGLVDQPVVFATNRLVMLVGKGNPKAIRNVGDLGRAGVIFVMADEGVPVGDYTRTVLANLDAENLVAKAASQEENVRAVTSKVALGEADAGFAYATDALAVSDDVEAIELPAAAQPPIRYGIAVVRTSKDKAAARAFVDAVLSTTGRAALESAGFGLP